MPRFSIGWRMGVGEDYVYEFANWWDTLDNTAQQDCQQRYPEPPDWLGWYRDEEENDGKFTDDED